MREVKELSCRVPYRGMIVITLAMLSDEGRGEVTRSRVDATSYLEALKGYTFVESGHVT